MANYTIDVLTDGIEQGSIDSGGNASSSTQVRSTGYLPFLGDDDGTVIMTATATTGKDIQLDLLGYTSDTTTSPTFDMYWKDSPYNFDISSYSNVKYFRVVLKYKDGSALPPEEVASCTIVYNYTYPWHWNDDTPSPISAMPVLHKGLVKPHPDGIWRIGENNGGVPYTHKMMSILYVEPTVTLGAFEDAASLDSVHVPISVKTIGPTAFKGTALQRVKIAADCTYEETSFPEACVIERYPDDRYGQLYDSAGKAVLDYDARRVYVLKEDTSNG